MGTTLLLLVHAVVGKPASPVGDPKVSSSGFCARSSLDSEAEMPHAAPRCPSARRATYRGTVDRRCFIGVLSNGFGCSRDTVGIRLARRVNKDGSAATVPSFVARMS